MEVNMVNLNSAPAFGFETSSCNAEGYYKNLFETAQKKAAEIQKANIAQLDFPDMPNVADVYNDPEFKKIMDEQNTKAAKTAWKTANLMKRLGWIPLLGTLIGINRISRTVKATKQELPNKVNHIVRGIFELFSLGFLLLIPDLILTRFRAKA